VNASGATPGRELLCVVIAVLIDLVLSPCRASHYS
jgi:hypothetical protein